MKAVNFTTISRQLNTTHSAHVDPYFCGSCPCTNSIKYTRFQDVRALMDVFYERCKGLHGLRVMRTCSSRHHFFTLCRKQSWHKTIENKRTKERKK